MGQYKITEVTPSPVNASQCGSLHATGDVTIITMVTYRSPLTLSGISLIAFLLLLVLVDCQAAMPGIGDNGSIMVSHSPAARQLW